MVARSVERREIKFALHVKQDHFFALMKEKACCKCGTPLGFYFFVARVHSMLFYLFLDIMLFLVDFHAFRKHNNVKISCEILRKKGRNISFQDCSYQHDTLLTLCTTRKKWNRLEIPMIVTLSLSIVWGVIVTEAAPHDRSPKSEWITDAIGPSRQDCMNSMIENVWCVSESFPVGILDWQPNIL